MLFYVIRCLNGGCCVFLDVPKLLVHILLIMAIIICRMCQKHSANASVYNFDDKIGKSSPTEF